MDSTDEYAHSKLLYRGDTGVTTVYQQLIKMLHDKEVNKEELVKEIDDLIFLNVKYQNALIASKKDHDINKQAQSASEMEIESTKEEIKQLIEKVKMAKVVRSRKLKFNSMAKDIQAFQTNSELNQKIEKVEAEIKRIQEAYDKEVNKIHEKQRNLKLALSALHAFLKEEENENSHNN